MTLIPITHARRVSPAEAAALFRALGQKWVSARGFHTADPARCARVIAAAVPKRESTISFAGGTLNATSRAALDRLATQALFAYLDLRTTMASLRIWPALYSWVHAAMPAGGTAAVSAVFGVPLTPGTTQIGDTRVKIDLEGGYPIDIQTLTIATALRLFHGFTSDRIDRGFVTSVKETAKEPLAQFLAALGTTVHAALEVPVTVACELTEEFAGEAVEWQAAGVIVNFPAGEIGGYLTTPKTGERDREQWQARITKALKRGKLA